MSLAIVKSLIEEQIEEGEFGGKTRAIAPRLARRQGFAGDPARYDWVASGFWLLASGFCAITPTTLACPRA
jgi:hypothetical protein